MILYIYKAPLSGRSGHKKSLGIKAVWYKKKFDEKKKKKAHFKVWLWLNNCLVHKT